MMMKAKDMLPLLGLPLLLVAGWASGPSTRVESSGAEPSPISSDADRPSKKAVAESAPGADDDRLILVLRTRRHRVTVSGGDRSPKYTVHNDRGTLLARRIDSAALKERFPELYEVATGVAWSGIRGPLVLRGK